MAINELRRKLATNHCNLLPYACPMVFRLTNKIAVDAIAFIQPDRVLTVNIKGAVLASEQALREAGIELSDFVRGNEKRVSG